MSGGKVCKKCGGSEFYKNRACKACSNKVNAAWREANKDRLRAINADWRRKNTERVKANKKRYEELNRERYLAIKRESAKKCYRPEKNAEWRAANPEKVRLQHQSRRVRKKASNGSLSKDIVARLLVLQRGKCACCSRPLGDDFHLDHIVPLALGGPHSDENMQLLRKSCNQSKSSKHPVDFMQLRGFLL